MCRLGAGWSEGATSAFRSWLLNACVVGRCSWYAVCKLSVRLRFWSGGELSVVRLRSITGVWYVSGMSWL